MSKLKEYRLNKNLNQKTLSELIEISQQRYSHYETGKRELPVSIAKRIGKILKINWWKLYEE